MSLFPQLFYFALTLAALIWLSRRIAVQVQMIGLRLTGSERAALFGYYLLLLPGIILHELSHAAMALILGLKVGKLELGPKVRGRVVELGSVRIGRGGALRDSLVGLAPFLSGTAVLLIVGYQVFDVAGLGRAFQQGGWPAMLAAVDGIWRVPDFWLWAYVIFVASNAMIPSPADREPWLTAVAYLGMALVLVYLAGGLPFLANTIAPDVAGMLQIMTLAFVFTLVLDVLAAALLWTIETVIMQFQHG